MTARSLARLGLLLAATLAVQMTGLPQPITGPAVNAMLILATIFVGPTGAVAIGVLTPWGAFLRGILPPPLGPAIPFITLGNAMLVLTYYAGRRLSRSGLLGGRLAAGGLTGWGSCIALAAAAIAKYLMLASAVQFLLHLPPQLAGALGLPQLLTALVGGAIALPVAHALRGLGVRVAEPDDGG